MRFILEATEYSNLLNYFYDFIDEGFVEDIDKRAIKLKSGPGLKFSEYTVFLRKIFDTNKGETIFQKAELEYQTKTICDNIESAYLRLKEKEEIKNLRVQINYHTIYVNYEYTIDRESSLNPTIHGFRHWFNDNNKTFFLGERKDRLRIDIRFIFIADDKQLIDIS